MQGTAWVALQLMVFVWITNEEQEQFSADGNLLLQFEKHWWAYFKINKMLLNGQITFQKDCNQVQQPLYSTTGVRFMSRFCSQPDNVNHCPEEVTQKLT